MKAPSILVFATQYMPTGGIESHLREFCLHLSRSGVAVDLVVSNSQMTLETETFFKSVCRRVYLGNKGKSYFRFLWLLFIGLKLSSKKYDAFYSNGQGESIWLFSKMIRGRKRWVHHHHTSGDAADQATWGGKYKRALLSANAVIACSHRNARTIELALPREISSIPCFSRKVEVNPVIKNGKKLRFGYYGRFLPEKGIDTICKLSSDPELEHIEFHLWGEGEHYPPSFFKNFPLMHIHGPFSGEKELTKVISSLDALLLISKSEGLPIILLEAMSAGLPWLATDPGGIPEIALDKYATRIIPVSSNYEQVKASVISLSNDILGGKVSRDSQKELYMEKFSPSALVIQWRNMLGMSNYQNN